MCAAGGASHQTLDCDTVSGVFSNVGDTHIGAIAGTGGYLEVLDGSFTIYSQYTVDLQVRVSNAGDWITVDTISCSSGCGAIETKFSYVVNHHHTVYAADSVWRFFFTCTERLRAQQPRRGVQPRGLPASRQRQPRQQSRP